MASAPGTDRHRGSHPAARNTSPIPRDVARLMTDTKEPVPARDKEIWTELRKLTAARIGLARSGAALSTKPLLDFRLAHARARDAVYETLDEARLVAGLKNFGMPVV